MMKLQMTGYFRRSPMWRDRLAHLLVFMFFLAISAQAQDQMLAPIGGPGGSEFVARCPAGQILGGLEMRTGDDIDAIRPLCIKPIISIDTVAIEPGNPAYDPNKYDQQYEEVRRYGYSDPIATTDWYGGPGGGGVSRITGGWGITGIYVESEGVHRVTVNGIALVSYRTMASSPVVDANELSQIQENMGQVPESFRAPINYDAEHAAGSSMCPIGDDGWTMTVVGIHGRTGVFVDAIGLICGYPVFPPPPVQLGRVQGSTPAPPPDRIDGEPMICAYARSARARNSPAAPYLEAQCEVARRALPPVALGRIQSTTPSPPIIPLDGELPICARARDARARNSPAAPSLQSRCDADRAGAANHVITRAPSNAAEIAGSRARIFTQPSAAPAPPAAQLPVEQPPAAQPPVAQAPAKPGNAFMPPTFVDGAQLWACANAVQGKVKGAACPGLQAGRMYCRRHGFSGALQTRADGTPDLMVAAAQPGSPVRAVNGEACTANNCAVISELGCAP